MADHPTRVSMKARYGLGTILFTGTGKNDATVWGTGADLSAEAVVPLSCTLTISSTSPDKFTYTDGVVTLTGVTITGEAQALSHGMYVKFTTVSGHTAADKYTWSTLDVLYDAMIDTVILSARDWLQGKCNRLWGVGVTPSYQYFDAYEDVLDAGRSLLLRQPCVSVSEILNGDGEVIPITEYALHPIRRAGQTHAYTEIKLNRLSGYRFTYTTAPERAIRVSGVWGDAADVPQMVSDAEHDLAYALLKNSGLREKISAGGEDVDELDGLPLSVRLVLESSYCDVGPGL